LTIFDLIVSQKSDMMQFICLYVYLFRLKGNLLLGCHIRLFIIQLVTRQKHSELVRTVDYAPNRRFQLWLVITIF